MPLICDRRQVGQALTNMLKNAAEAIEGRAATAGGDAAAGRDLRCLEATTARRAIVVEDNGKGLPAKAASG